LDKYKIAVIAGTTEGRLFAQYLDEREIKAVVLVATEYGERVLPPFKYCKVHTGRLNELQMTDFFQTHAVTHVYDATHPYAKEVTFHCKRACASLGILYRRIIRENVMAEDYIMPNKFRRFDHLAQAVGFLKNTEGNILVTTGAKETEVFTQLPHFGSRIILRTLPDEGLITKLEEKGFVPTHILMGQGPFDKEQNLQTIRQFHIQYMLTKESGMTGGFVEKLEAAKEEDVFVLLIKRPQETGITLQEAVRTIDDYIRGD
jgi:precorrin-6x reductase